MNELKTVAYNIVSLELQDLVEKDFVENLAYRFGSLKQIYWVIVLFEQNQNLFPFTDTQQLPVHKTMVHNTCIIHAQIVATIFFYLNIRIFYLISLLPYTTHLSVIRTKLIKCNHFTWTDSWMTIRIICFYSIPIILRIIETWNELNLHHDQMGKFNLGLWLRLEMKDSGERKK